MTIVGNLARLLLCHARESESESANHTPSPPPSSPSPSRDGTATATANIGTDRDTFAQKLTEYVLRKHNYQMTLNDAHDLIDANIWGTVEEFVEYMRQFGAAEGVIEESASSISIDVTNNNTITTAAAAAAEARLYSTTELNLMASDALPITYGLSSRYARALADDRETDSSSSDTDSSDTGSDSEETCSTCSGSSVDTLPLYVEGDRPPSYSSGSTSDSAVASGRESG